MAAQTLNCPMCGAAAATESTKCDHCGARLATVACPSCFGMIFKGAKFCSHCGSRAERNEADEAFNHSCPQCKLGLEAVTVGKCVLRECRKCEGLWLDRTSFEQICTDREQQSAVLGLALTLPQNAVGGVDLKVRYHPCPICRSLMNRVNFAKCSGVIVDVCRTHGTWFDKDELRRIVEFLRGGGMDRARAIEIEDLKRQRQKLKDEQTASALDSSRDWQHSRGWPGRNYGLVELGVSAAVDALFDMFGNH